jgi:hypothetical protein
VVREEHDDEGEEPTFELGDAAPTAVGGDDDLPPEAAYPTERDFAAREPEAAHDAEGQVIPAHLEPVWRLLEKPALRLAQYLEGVVRNWGELRDQVAAHLKERGEASIPTDAIARLESMLAEKPANPNGLAHLASRVDDLAPYAVCDGCGGKGGAAVGLTCCKHGWHSEKSWKERRTRIAAGRGDQQVIGPTP